MATAPVQDGPRAMMPEQFEGVPTMQTTFTVELQPTGAVSKGGKEILKAKVQTPDGEGYITFYRNAAAVAPKEAKATAPVVRKAAGKTAEAPAAPAPAAAGNPLASLTPENLKALVAALKGAGL